MLDLEHFDASSRLIERVSMRKSAERATRRGQTTARAGMVHVTGRFSSPFPVHRFLLKDVRSERWSHFQATRLAGKEEVVVPRSRFVRFARSRYIYICIYIRCCSSNVRLDRAPQQVARIHSARVVTRKNHFETRAFTFARHALSAFFSLHRTKIGRSGSSRRRIQS